MRSSLLAPLVRQPVDAAALRLYQGFLYQILHLRAYRVSVVTCPTPDILGFVITCNQQVNDYGRLQVESAIFEVKRRGSSIP